MGIKGLHVEVIRCVYNDCAERKRMAAELGGERENDNNHAEF